MHRADVARELLRDQLLRRDDAVEIGAFEYLGEVLAVDLGDDAADGALLRVERCNDIVAVVAGERDKSVRRADALLQQDFAARRVAADDVRAGQNIAQMLTSFRVAVNDGHSDTALLKQPCQVHRDAAAAHYHNVAHGLFILPHGHEELAQLLCGAGDAQAVARVKGEFAVRDDRLAAALHDADQHLRPADRRQVLQLHAVKLPVLAHAVLHDLDAALGEGIDSGGAREAQYARDLLGALVFGVYGYRQAEHLAQKLRLPQVLRVSYTRDDVLRAELARGDAADHVDLVLLGRGH